MQAFATRRLSCGIVVLSGQRELLLCHVTGRDQWDLPKGGAGKDESPIEAALRETREETGLLFGATDLVDIGRHAFSERKELHLYAARTERFDVARLSCESHFSHAWSGTRLPEMDGYGWFDIDRAPSLCSPKMARLLAEKIDLAELAARDMKVVQPVFMTSPAAHRQYVAIAREINGSNSTNATNATIATPSIASTAAYAA